MMIRRIIAVVRMVPSKAVSSTCRLRARKQAARISATITPSAAASVGVAKPA